MRYEMAVFPIFFQAKIWLRPSVECCAYLATVLYFHFALAFFVSIFTSQSSCFGLSETRYFFIPEASATCARFCVSKPSPVHASTCLHCVFSTKSWSTLRTRTMTLQHAVDVQIFESAPEFLRSLNSGSCPLDGRCWCISETGRSLVWNSQQVGRPWLTSA